MNKMVKKGDVVVCLKSYGNTTEGCQYTVWKVTSAKFGNFQIVDDEGDFALVSWDWGYFKKA